MNNTWQIKPLKDLCFKAGEYGLNSPAVPLENNLPLYLRITDITEDGYYSLEHRVSVDYFGTNKLLQKNDLLFARTGATVGKTYLHKEENNKIAFAGYLIRFIPNSSKIHPYFLSIYCQTQAYWNWVKIFSMRSGQPGISAEEYGNLPIPVPPLSEQHRIVAVLETWDKAISLTKRLIDQKEIQKKHLMRQLLTPKHDWKTKKLGEILKIGHGRDYKHLKKGEIPVFGTGGYMTSVNEFLYDGETVCIGRKGTINKPFYHKGKIWTVDTLFYTYNFQNVLPKYLYYMFCTIDWLSMNEASGVPSLTAKNIEDVLIAIPTLKEQQAIAEVLSAADKEISLLKQKLAKLTEQKKGLMQVLLTGKVRLTI